MPNIQDIEDKDLKLCGDYSDDVVERKCDIASQIIQDHIKNEKERKDREEGK